jgi:predicted SprT family Zn-dependent metalloprotease
MCHAAAWLVDKVGKPPHGSIFKKWAHKAMTAFPHLNVATCHSYQINYKFQYQCQTDWCMKIYGRHSKSIDTGKLACGVCRGALKLLPRLKVSSGDVVDRCL